MSFPLTNMLLARAKDLELLVSNDDVLGYFDNRTASAVTINGSSEYLTGIYQEPDLGTYSGDINNLTEQQITDLANGEDFDGAGENSPWSTLEKTWILENLEVSSSNSAKRYGFVFETYDAGVLNIPIVNSGARGFWGSLNQAIFDSDVLPPDFVPGSLPILQGSSDITDWEVGVVGLLNFDGVDDYVEFSTIPNVEGTKTISFSLYFKNFTSIGAFEPIIQINDNASDRFEVYLTSTLTSSPSIVFDVGANASNNFAIYLSEFSTGVVYDFVINKTTGNVTSVTVNGVSAMRDDGASVNLGNSTALIGTNGSVYQGNCLLWDFIIGSTFNAPGQPNGNQASAWTNGSFTATVYGSPATTDIAVTQGLATNWTETDGSNFGTPSIVTGNGFFNRAQRYFLNFNGTAYIESDLLSVTSGEDYVLSLRIRTSLGSKSIQILDSSNNVLVSENVVGPTGDAEIVQLSPTTINVSEIKIRVLLTLAATYAEIDEIELIQI